MLPNSSLRPIHAAPPPRLVSAGVAGLLLAALEGWAQSAAPSPRLAQASAPAPRFEVVVVAETGEIHDPFVKEGKVWLNQLAKDSNFAVTYVSNPNGFTDAYLERFDLILQLNYTPWRWNLTAKAAFEKYVEEGRGGWIGLHHSLLFGSQFLPQGEPLWTWFYDFMGKINYKNYIASFAEGTVHVEAPQHPVFAGVPDPFVVTTEEWYTWDRSPRPNVRVLANVDENSYKPNSNIKMGDHPVVWTNEKYEARNLFLFMGHHPNLFQNQAYKTLLRNAIFWAAAKPDAVSARRPATSAGRIHVRIDPVFLSVTPPGGDLLGLSLHDASGRVHHRASGRGISGLIDRSRLPPGSYLVRAETSGGTASRWVDLD